MHCPAASSAISQNASTREHSCHVSVRGSCPAGGLSFLPTLLVSELLHGIRGGNRQQHVNFFEGALACCLVGWARPPWKPCTLHQTFERGLSTSLLRLQTPPTRCAPAGKSPLNLAGYVKVNLVIGCLLCVTSSRATCNLASLGCIQGPKSTPEGRYCD